MKPSPHWTILGAGALGCLWAANLCRSGFAVTLLTRRPPLKKTVSLIDSNGTTLVHPDIVSVEEFLRRQQPIERLLLTTKSHQALEALQTIDAAINRNTQLFVLQNGMAALDVAHRYPDNPLVAGVTTDGAYLNEDQEVVHSGVGITHLGRYDGAPDDGLIEKLPCQHLMIEWVDDIELRQWRKLAVNCAINGLTAIYHCRNGALLENPAALQRMERICQEAAAVAAKLTQPPDCLQDCYPQALETTRITAVNYSSMYKDIEQGRATEIDYLNGYLCRQGEHLGIPCPENAAVLRAIRQLEQRAGTSR